MRPVRFHQASVAELEAILDWYVARSPTAAALLADRIEEATATLPEMPEAWPSWPGRQDVRIRRLGRFPFSMIYRISDTEILVIAIAHARRRPGYWLPRLVP